MARHIVSSGADVAIASAAVLAPLVLVVAVAAAHAVLTRVAWKRGRAQRRARVAELVGNAETIQALWGFDTIRAIRAISRLRREPRPQISPHFVVGFSGEGIWMIFGPRGDQGVTFIAAKQIREVKASSSGPSVFTTLFLKVQIAERTFTIPVRISDPSSDFLNADYSWAVSIAARIKDCVGV